MGRGAGKGGGGGGSIREAGGALGKRAAAEEERYFRWDSLKCDLDSAAHCSQFLSLFFCRQKEREQLAMLRSHHEEEIEHHGKEIERLQKEIDRHKGKIRKLKHDD